MAAIDKKPDLAHRLTDQELTALEERIAAEYQKAADELTGKIDAYFESFKKRDEETKALIGTIVNGKEYTEQDYQQWRLAQIGRGKRFEALLDRLAERMTSANEVAAAYINDATPGLYSLNRNYVAYTIEQQVGADVGFAPWDEQTVKRHLVEQPDLMPYYPPKRAVQRGFDIALGNAADHRAGYQRHPSWGEYQAPGGPAPDKYPRHGPLQFGGDAMNSYPDFGKTCGLGSVTGIGGANCR